MKNPDPTYEEIVERILQEWDHQIEQFKAYARNADPADTSRYQEAIGFLLANRETARRRLLGISDADVEAPGRSREASHGGLKEALYDKFDVVQSPKQTYGPEE